MVVSPLNDTEIVLMGSSDPISNEVFIFNTQTKLISLVGSGGDIEGFYTG